ncbi:hypothetical protein Csa_018862 [Cucumis sativus]|uniref:Uncharacterized protein n=1 Tax=Cucumis sativus TaxID=3659 RepID=A0A0A0KPI1_CUCSA|nr:hypothetical protein Csa_018862 [Cucumis sativus]
MQPYIYIVRQVGINACALVKVSRKKACVRKGLFEKACAYGKACDKAMVDAQHDKEGYHTSW